MLITLLLQIWLHSQLGVKALTVQSMAVGLSGFVRVLQVSLSLSVVGRTHTTKSYV